MSNLKHIIYDILDFGLDLSHLSKWNDSFGVKDENDERNERLE